jgi:hypothetical protein
LISSCGKKHLVGELGLQKSFELAATSREVDPKLRAGIKIVDKEARDILDISDKMMARLELYMTGVELEVSNMMLFQGQQLPVMYY